jgi:hypothetical protein
MADDKELEEKFREASKQASADFDEFPTKHEFEMADECNDKDGNPTKVLILDTDPDGDLVFDLLVGNPVRFDPNPDSPDFVTDEEKFDKYFQLMVNVDVSSRENKRAVGWKALSRARSQAESFFTLAVVSRIHDALVTAN